MAGTPKHAPEFKQQAAEPCKKPDTACAEAARGPGAGPGSLSGRVRQADRSAEDDPRPQNPFQTAEGLRKLRREDERLRRENEILLKAGAFFASKALRRRLSSSSSRRSAASARRRSRARR